jgi:hypothetical protein
MTPPRPRDLVRRLAELEEKTEVLAIQRADDNFSRNTHLQIKQLSDAIRDLMTPPEPAKRPIGFVTQEDKGTKGLASGKT